MIKLFMSRVIEHANLTLNQWKHVSNVIVDFCGH